MRLWLYAPLILLCLNVTPTIAAERYGAWLLEYPRSSVVTLSFQQSVALKNEVVRSTLGFICDQADDLKLVAVLVPLNLRFENWRNVVRVLARKRGGKLVPFDLLQNWKNGNGYIFLDTNDEVRELASFLQAEETDSEKTIDLYFPRSGDAGLEGANHIAIDVSGFTAAFSTFQMTCASAG